MPTNFVARSLAIAIASGVALYAQGTQNARTQRPAEVTAPSTSTDSQPSRQRSVIIGPGDVVKVEVLGPDSVRQTFSKDCLVGIDGYFEYPRLGRIQAQGRTPDEIKAELTRKLDAELVNPQVTVAVDQKMSKRVSVGGEVRAVGQIPYSGRIGVLEAVIRANGITDLASDEALILKPGEPNVHVDLAGLLAGDLTKDVALEDGDTLWVPKATPVFVQGAVNNPGPYVIRKGATVQQVINQAGGISEKGRTSGIKIQRPYADPKKKPLEIPVKDYKTEIVKPGDTIIVPNRWA